MLGFGVGRFVVVARRWRSLILESGSAHSVVLLTVGTLACRAVCVGPSGIGNPAVQVMGVSLVIRVRRMGFRREWLVRGLVWGLLWEGCVGSDQLVVIRRMYRKVSPRFGRVVVLRVGGRVRVFQELVLVGLGLRKGWCWGGWSGRGGGTVASWSCSLAEGPGSWCSARVGSGARAGEGVAGYGVGGGFLPQKPASPDPTTPTHAEMVARLHELFVLEKRCL